MCVQVDEMHGHKYRQHDMTVWFNGGLYWWQDPNLYSNNKFKKRYRLTPTRMPNGQYEMRVGKTSYSPKNMRAYTIKKKK